VAVVSTAAAVSTVEVAAAIAKHRSRLQEQKSWVSRVRVVFFDANLGSNALHFYDGVALVFAGVFASAKRRPDFRAAFLITSFPQ
jgi:hypothetical protein